MFQSFFFGSPNKDKDEQRALAAASPTPLMEEGGSGSVMLRSSTNPSALGLKQLVKQAAPPTIVDTETRTEASSDADDASVGSVGDVDAGAAKGKEALVDSLLDGKVSALSPHRLMQAGKCVVLCCLYMAVGTYGSI